MPDPLLPAEIARRLAVIRECDAQGHTRRHAADLLGLKPSTLSQWVSGLTPEEKAELNEERLPDIPPPPVVEPPSPVERHDSAFHRKRAAALEKEVGELSRLAEELAGLRETPCAPPEWLDQSHDADGRSMLIAHTSDLHMGEVIDAAEIGGINRYNPDIARERMERYFRAVVAIGKRWQATDTCDGVLLTMGGDLISGDLHDDHVRTNSLTSQEQVAAVIETYHAGIEYLLRHFPRVHVAAVPGNHGRTTAKPPSKLVARMSYDILAASMLRDRMRGESRVTWKIADGADAEVVVYQRPILVTHGDRMGTGGGQGFAGPVLPIVRGAHKVRAQAASAGRACYLILSGHYHTSAAPPGVLANGSVVGYGEYANGLRMSAEPPQQWLARMTPRWGLCERIEVKLDAPIAGKPRVRASAA